MDHLDIPYRLISNESPRTLAVLQPALEPSLINCTSRSDNELSIWIVISFTNNYKTKEDLRSTYAIHALSPISFATPTVLSSARYPCPPVLPFG
jgi:hypothetical protein